MLLLQKISGIYAFWMYLLLFSLESSMFMAAGNADFPLSASNRIAATTRACYRDSSKPSTRFTDGNPCDATHNCRFGGLCKSTGVSSFKEAKPHDNSPDENVCACEMTCPRRSHRSVARSHYVCGTDGRTYENECQLNLAACRCQYPIEVRWKGSCEKGQIYEDEEVVQNTIVDDFDNEEFSGSGDYFDELDVQLCGGGITCKYGAVCDVDAEDGPCLCNINCHGTPNRVICGSDGRSYINECSLEAEACRSQEYVVVYHEGPCKDDEEFSLLENSGWGSGEKEVTSDSEEDVCSFLNCIGDVIEPVCGSDGNDYTNVCVLRLAECTQRRTIKILHGGFCDDKKASNKENTMEKNTHEDELEKNPCDSMFCLYGAACVPIGKDHGKCSCDDICNADSLKIDQSSFADFGDISLDDARKFVPNYPFDILDKLNQEELARTTSHTAPATTSPTSQRLPRSRAHKVTTEEAVIESLDNIQGIKLLPFREKNNLHEPRFNGFNAGNSKRKSHGLVKSRTRRTRGHSFRRQKRSLNENIMLSYRNETICGTDGKTYANECQMRIHACHAQKIVNIKKVGACPLRFEERLESKSFSQESTTMESKTRTALDDTSSTLTLPPRTTKKVIPDYQADRLDENIDTSVSNDHTDSQTKSTAMPLTTEPNYLVVNNNNILKLTNRNDSTNSPHLKSPVSEANAMEYSWLIAVSVMIVLVVIGLIIGFWYRSSKQKENRNITDFEVPSCETLVTVTSNDAKATSCAEAEPLNA